MGSELIDRQIAQLGQLALLEALPQMLLMDLFDEVPAHAQQAGHSFKGGDAAQLDHVLGEGVRVAPFARSEGNRLAQGLAAMAAGLPVSSTGNSCSQQSRERLDLSAI